MNIYIFYEHLSREWNASVRIKNELKKRGENVWIYSIIFERTKAILNSKKNKPDVILMPWFVDKVHEEILEPLLRKSPKAIVINLHQEEISSCAYEKTLLPHTNYTRNGSYHFVWGTYFKTKLLQEGVNSDLIFITGNSRNDEGKLCYSNKMELAEEYQLDKKKRWILFAENRGWILQRNDERTKAELVSRNVPKQAIEEEIEYSRKSLDAFVKQMKKLSKKFSEQYELIYRPHPGTQFTEELPNCVHVIAEKSIYEWINTCDLFLTCESTSIFEAEMCGKICATIDDEFEPEIIRMPGIDRYPKINNLNDINEALIEELVDEQRERAPIYTDYIGLVDGKSCERVAEAIVSISENKVRPEVPLEAEKSLRRDMRQALYETVTFATAYTGLINEFHFPKSAYTEARDIPFSPQNKWIKS